MFNNDFGFTRIQVYSRNIPHDVPVIDFACLRNRITQESITK